jgi:hypothetical protein
MYGGLLRVRCIFEIACRMIDTYLASFFKKISIDKTIKDLQGRNRE